MKRRAAGDASTCPPIAKGYGVDQVADVVARRPGSRISWSRSGAKSTPPASARTDVPGGSASTGRKPGARPDEHLQGRLLEGPGLRHQRRLPPVLRAGRHPVLPHHRPPDGLPGGATAW
ncbi:MAG: hypothetical protein MZV70_11950 [Desulfobacterales bacterium]|nr:hypothetical protein [Desulfobacterales bacterium]